MLNAVSIIAFSERIKEFIEDYGLIALAAVPSLVLIGILLAVFIKLLINDPKGTLGALFLVLGALAAFTVPGLLWDPDKWASVVYLLIIGAILLFAFKSNPRRFVKILMITLAVIAGIVVIGFAFGIQYAAAVAVNLVFPLFLISCVSSIRNYKRLEKEGVSVEGRFVRWEVHGRNAYPIFSFTTEEGEYVETAVSDFSCASRKITKQSFTLLYDKNDHKNVCVKNNSLRSSIITLCLFLVLEAAIFAGTLYMLIILR